MTRAVWCRIVCCGVAVVGCAVFAQDRPAEDGGSPRQNMQELWRASIAPPVPTTGPEETERLAEQLRSMQLRPRQAVSRPAPTTQMLAAAATQPAPGAGSLTQPAAHAVELTDANTLAELRKAAGTGLADAVHLADRLYKDGHLAGAYGVYNVALSKKPDGPGRDWVMFQMGNCLRDREPQAAADFYKRVAADCPDSEWAQAAAAMARHIQWKRTSGSQTAVRAGATTAPAALSATSRPGPPSEGE